jgi:prenyltransferase beta subunit
VDWFYDSYSQYANLQQTLPATHAIVLIDFIIVGGFDIIDEPFLRSFLLSCQHDIGGCGKYPDVFPDVLHTYFSLCGFAFLGEPDLQKVHCALGLTVRSAKRLAYLRAAGESE